MTREDLQNYQAIRRERDQLKRQMALLEDAARYAGGPKLDGMPRSSSGVGRPTEAAAIPQAELWQHYKRKDAELAERQLKVELAIDGLEPLQRTILRCHYIEGMRWEIVSEVMNYSLRHVMRIHENAMEQLGL